MLILFSRDPSQVRRELDLPKTITSPYRMRVNQNKAPFFSEIITKIDFISMGLLG